MATRILTLLFGLSAAALVPGTPCLAASTSSHTIEVRNSSRYPINAVAYDNDDTDRSVAASSASIAPGGKANLRCNTNGSCLFNAEWNRPWAEGGLRSFSPPHEVSTCVRVTDDYPWGGCF